MWFPPPKGLPDEFLAESATRCNGGKARSLKSVGKSIKSVATCGARPTFSSARGGLKPAFRVLFSMVFPWGISIRVAICGK